MINTLQDIYQEFNMLIPWKLYLIIGIFSLLVIGAITGYFFWSQSKMSDQDKKIGQQAVALEVMQTTNDSLKKSIDIINENLKKTNDDLTQIRINNKKWDKFFSTNNVAKQGSTNPRELEKQINDLTRDTFSSIENTSKGLPQSKEGDKNVQTLVK